MSAGCDEPLLPLHPAHKAVKTPMLTSMNKLLNFFFSNIHPLL
jgi:hypothetical protein